MKSNDQHASHQVFNHLLFVKGPDRLPSRAPEEIFPCISKASRCLDALS